jgi:predicted nucleotidyltransferase
MKEKIINLLKDVEKKQDIIILLAVESGSREWGFASNDSDYDVRCVHVSKIDNYIGLNPKNEQIDLIEGDIDIVSWDIRKFFSLLLKSNPTVSEWLSSKLVYIEKEFNGLKKRDIYKLFSDSFSRQKISYHYLSLAKQNYGKYIDKEDKVSLKKYVYILRALGCVEYINKTNSLPPLNWKLSSKYLPKEIKKKFEKLVELKKSAESMKGKRDEFLDKWIESKLSQTINQDKDNFNKEEINNIVIKTIKQYS